MAEPLNDFKLEGLKYLAHCKNLLGFSAQVDSTCLFFILLECGIEFDLAIVDYGIRIESKDEVAYARELANKFNKQIYIASAPHFHSHFEKQARDFRFKFFDEIILEHSYKNLILANQFNDKVEWFLMQLCRGSGLNTLLGFEAVVELESYNIIRPLINTNRGRIIDFLHSKKIKYFNDLSNDDISIMRNYFRKYYANTLVEEFNSGLLKSFKYLSRDFDMLFDKSLVHCVKSDFVKIFIIKKSLKVTNLHNIDICTKKLGYVLSSSQRDEIVRCKYSCEVANKIVIDCNAECIFVTKKQDEVCSKTHIRCGMDINNNIRMDIKKENKRLKEELRVAHIPPKIRPYVDIKMLKELKERMKFCEI